MSSRTKQRRSGGLTLLLYQRTLHPELFRILATERVSRRAYDADIWLVEGGHVITLTAGKNTLRRRTDGPPTSSAGRDLSAGRLGLRLLFPGGRTQATPKDDGVTPFCPARYPRAAWRRRVFPNPTAATSRALGRGSDPRRPPPSGYKDRRPYSGRCGAGFEPATAEVSARCSTQ